jgi:hypothetical protein
VFLVLCLALSVCLLASPRPPQMNLPVVAASDEAAQSGEDKLVSLVDGPLGPYSLELTEEEATSLLALRLPGSPFLNPQVRFVDQRAYISGVVNMGVPLKVVSMWTVDASSGRPRVLLERAAIGPFSLATFLLSSVSATMNEMIDESGTGIFPTAVRFGDQRIIIEMRKDTPTVP